MQDQVLKEKKKPVLLKNIWKDSYTSHTSVTSSFSPFWMVQFWGITSNKIWVILFAQYSYYYT